MNVFIVEIYYPVKCTGDHTTHKKPTTHIDSTRMYVASTYEKAEQYCLENLEDLNEDKQMYYSICFENIDPPEWDLSGCQIATVRADGEVNDFREDVRRQGFEV